MGSRVIIALSVVAIFVNVAYANKLNVLSEISATENRVGLNVTEKECYDLVRLATVADQVSMVKLLAGQGCSVNRPANSNRKEPTPLHIAVINNSVRMVTELLALGADVNARAVMADELEGKTPVCRFMLKDGSSTN